MKKWLLSLLCASLFLTGCFETTEEMTIHEDGSGTFSNTSDLSSLLALAQNMGTPELEKLKEQKIDTTFSLAAQGDSAKDLSAEDRELFKVATMTLQLDGSKFLTRINFPFKNYKDALRFNKLSAKVLGNTMKGMMGEEGAASQLDQMPEVTSFDDYYDVEMEKGEIKKSLNKAKFANAQNDEYLKGLKETAGMGIPVTATYIINLPKPATKVEGKTAKLSEDKKQVTIKVDIDDFFDDPEKLEFKIKY